MWYIQSITGPGSEQARIIGGLPGAMAERRIGERLGPQGARYMVVANGGVLFLEDIGVIGTPAPGLDWGVRINGTQAGYYNGEGYLDIHLDGAGNATITGVSSGFTAQLATPSPGLVVQPPNLSCGFAIAEPTASSLRFATGPTAVNVTVMVHSAAVGTSIDTVGFQVTRSDGLTINASTAPSESLVLNVLDSNLVYARFGLGGAFEWTVDISNPFGIPCSVVAMIGSDVPPQDGQYYASLPAPVQTQLATLGLYQPPTGPQLQWFWDNWACSRCQMAYYLLGGLIAATAPEVFAAVTYERLAGGVVAVEIINQLVVVLTNLLQVPDEGVARTIAEGIADATDPLAWPAIICKGLGSC